MNKAKTDSESEYCGMDTPQETPDWNSINWKKVERAVFKLQNRIYEASQRGDVKTVRKLQKTLLRSYNNRLLAIRRVTQDNQGKKTAGVDGVKSLSPKERLELAQNLKLTGKSKPTRRVWIPKPERSEKRPLGIPTMYDRALQALVKNALEPEWEAKFEPNSYGFRIGRRAQDAIKQIWNGISQKPKYILDADIAKCFDQIEHLSLLQKLNIKGGIRRQIKSWLNAGVIDNGVFEESQRGTPQGGVISPLLANIALHGLEQLIEDNFPATKNGILVNCKSIYGETNVRRPMLIRYADDFVVIGDNKAIILKCKELISDWLKIIGLELKAEKTRIAHTLNPDESEDGKVGFDFLGHHFRQVKAGKYTCKRDSKRRPLGFNVRVTPSEQAKLTHQRKLREVILKKHAKSPQAVMIAELNPIIRGWSNYYICSNAQTTGDFSKQDHLMWLKLRSWERKRARNVDRSRYYNGSKQGSSSNWRFGTPNITLNRHADFSASIDNYVKVKGDKSPYDGDWVYWGQRLQRYQGLDTQKQTLLKKQKGKCNLCGLSIRDTDIVEVDHITPKSMGGSNQLNNLQLLHRHCHDEKTAHDGSQKLHNKDRHAE